jgi:deoxyribonuclease (pyrimidine dimer)
VLSNIHKNFTLNAGHVRFFYAKLLFLEERYDKLIEELGKRKFNLNSTRVLDFEGIPDEFFNSWIATETDNAIVRERIEQKIKMKPHWYKFYGN